MTTAVQHQYTYSTTRAAKTRRPPVENWKELNRLPNIKDWPETGAIAAGLVVYADKSQILGSDGYMWVETLIGWIRADGLKLDYQKVPAHIEPTIPPAGDVDRDKIIAAALAILAAVHYQQ